MCARTRVRASVCLCDPFFLFLCFSLSLLLSLLCPQLLTHVFLLNEFYESKREHQVSFTADSSDPNILPASCWSTFKPTPASSVVQAGFCASEKSSLLVTATLNAIYFQNTTNDFPSRPWLLRHFPSSGHGAWPLPVWNETGIYVWTRLLLYLATA